MLNEVIATKRPDIEITPRAVEVSIGEDVAPLILCLPPRSEIERVRSLSSGNVSVQTVAHKSDSVTVPLYEAEVARLQTKFPNDSGKVLLSHLATLNELSGRLSEAEECIREGVERYSTDFFKHKLGTNLVFQNRAVEAARIFESLDLQSDLIGNLRLAQLAFAKKDFQSAERYVGRALEIDALDFRSRLLAGAIELTQNRFVNAIRHFRVAIEEMPNSSVAYVNIGIAYWFVGAKEKATHSLRMAVAINPLNANATAFYTDLLIEDGRAALAIEVIERFLEFEQKAPEAWERLGRAHFENGNFKAALKAFEMQASLRPGTITSANIAIVHLKLNDERRAEQYFGLSMKQLADSGQEQLFPIKAFSNYWMSRRRFDQVYALTNWMMTPEGKERLILDERVSSILNDHLVSMLETGRQVKAIAEVESILRRENVNIELRANLLIIATYFYTLVKPNAPLAIDFCRQGVLVAEECGLDRKLVRSLLLNNVMFGLLEFGQTEAAEVVGKKLGALFHKESMPTATLGLLHFRKGNVERAEALYREAISLTPNGTIKERLRQKLNLELGRSYLQQGDQKRARICFEKVKDVSDGISLFVAQANSFRSQLRLVKK